MSRLPDSPREELLEVGEFGKARMLKAQTTVANRWHTRSAGPWGLSFSRGSMWVHLYDRPALAPRLDRQGWQSRRSRSLRVVLENQNNTVYLVLPTDACDPVSASKLRLTPPPPSEEGLCTFSP
ncbi:hypothetical protein [Streptomyces sp. NPDC050538]|uniref:hypothetical protein n=1 Tax=Streptomyces sp. NPDC050538 TaxID=3365627 RepID=UPI0037892BC7